MAGIAYSGFARNDEDENKNRSNLFIIQIPAAACSEIHEGEGSDDIINVNLKLPEDDWLKGLAR
jgi:hypothetical protein